MQDPFAQFGLPRQFDVDAKQLHRRFLAISAKHHPDRFSDPFEQNDAVEQSAAINEAYRILASPERRANTLLQLLGGPAKENDQSLPPDLLMEMMETRETLEAAVAANDEAEIARLRQWAEQERQSHLDRIAELFARAHDPIADDLAAEIRTQLNVLRYIERMVEQMPR